MIFPGFIKNNDGYKSGRYRRKKRRSIGKDLRFRQKLLAMYNENIFSGSSMFEFLMRGLKKKSKHKLRHARRHGGGHLEALNDKELHSPGLGEGSIVRFNSWKPNV